jgi:GNAT superfamily N-acetyltransferase
VIVRAATPADRDLITAMALRFHASTPYASLLAVDPIRIGLLFDLATAQGVVLVAENVEALDILGFLGLVVLEHPLSGDRYAEEVAWWVEPAYRSGTLGPKLLREAEAWCRRAGCVFLKMAAPAGTTVGLFYERQGYAAVETAFLKRVAA